jgi:DNA-binding LytR/AlgR family response regulator
MRHKIRSPMKNMAYAESVSLGEMEKRLPPQFVRCHKLYIINIVYVDSIVGSLIYMADGTRIVAGRKYLADVRKELLAFAQK